MPARTKPLWDVAVVFGSPLIGTEMVRVASHNREHAVMLAIAARKWPPGSRFFAREVAPLDVEPSSDFALFDRAITAPMRRALGR